MKRLALITLAFAALASPPTVVGQDSSAARNRGTTASPAVVIPVAARPPAGMCRIWLDQVPVAQQPAPTDCASAVRNRPAKGRVVFGDDYVTPKQERAAKAPPFLKGFSPKPAARKPVARPDTTVFR